MNFLLFALFSTLFIEYCELTNNFADVPCGNVFTERFPKVVGGVDATPGEFPWLVSITRRGGHFCGGSLITRKHVLTAAHCLCGGIDFVSPRLLKITLGQHDLSKSNTNKYELSISSYKIHPNYTCGPPADDIAILEIKKPVEWTENVSPVCLPNGLEEEDYRNFDEERATVAGWGWTREDKNLGSKSDVLQKAEVNVLKNEKCQSWYSSQGKKVNITDTQMCAGFKSGGIDACWADSGGPLMVNSKSEMVIAGVVSTGIGCARPFLPGLYTRISEYIPWIREVINVISK